MFFANEDNAKVLGAFLRKAEAMHLDDKSRQVRLERAKEIVGYIFKSPEGWDERCGFNIKHIGEQFLRCLQDVDSSKPANIDLLYVFAYRFLCEFDFLVGAGKELGMELGRLKNAIQQDIGEMDSDVRSQIIYASFIMPANIAKEFINDSNIGVFSNFEKKINEAEQLKQQWDSELQTKEAETINLKDKLDEYKVAFNFVGLYQGFFGLGEKKDKEIFWLFWSLLLMGALILVPLIVELVIGTQGLFKGSSLGTDHLIVLLPLISIEVVLIYFFRVILMNYKSVKAQKLQIELRKTLCQFIQSYAEYSAKLKKQDGIALEKFENLIFSGLLSDPDKLPSTFDGLEQIGNLLKNLKAK